MIYVANDSLDPYFNFALEYYLITERQLPDDCVFLFWRTEPTLMVGKYQNTLLEINLDYVREHQIKLVRRLSGGGTIYTDPGGWQFSFLARGKMGQICFTEFLTPILQALRDLGLDVSFNGRNDLVIEGKKFSGNAQYQKNGYTVHHGSLLFDTNIEQMVRSTTVSDYKIQSKSIASVRERVVNLADYLPAGMDSLGFRDALMERILRPQDDVYALTREDTERIRQIASQQFDNWQSIYGNSPFYNIQRTGHFAGGTVAFRLDVQKGIITSADVHGDFFGTLEPDELCRALIGCPYRQDAVRSALDKLSIAQSLYQIGPEDLVQTIVDV